MKNKEDGKLNKVYPDNFKNFKCFLASDNLIF